MPDGLLYSGPIVAKGNGSLAMKLKGSITTDGFVSIEKTGGLEGPLIAESLDLHGEMNGKVELTGPAQVNPTGSIHGNLSATAIYIANKADADVELDISPPANWEEKQAEEEAKNAGLGGWMRKTINTAKEVTIGPSGPAMGPGSQMGGR